MTTIVETTAATLRPKIEAYIRDLQKSISEHGMFSKETMAVYDDWVEIPIAMTEEKILTVLDQMFDGYLVENKTSLSQVKDRWIFAHTGTGDINLIWVDSSHRVGWLLSDCVLVVAESVYESYITKMVWPVKEGLIPSPPPSRLKMSD